MLLHSLLEADLIDEFRVSLFPVILGSGKKLFGEGTTPAGLKLTESIVTPSGVTMNTDVSAGEVKTGSFPSDNPSKDELQRRERMKKGSW